MSRACFTENVLEATPDEIVCWSSRVTQRTVIEAIQSGATDMPAIRGATTACTLGRCQEMSPRRRCCSREIQQLIDTYSETKGDA